MTLQRKVTIHHNQTSSITRSITRAFMVSAGRRQARSAVRKVYRLLGTISSKTGFDPIVELSLSPLGIDARFTFHPLKRDLTFLLQSFVLHVYERHCSLEPGDVVVDCGAYIGDFTTRASRQVGPQGLVLAFEPNPRSDALCAKNILANRLTNGK